MKIVDELKLRGNAPNSFFDSRELMIRAAKEIEQWHEKWKMAVDTLGSNCGEILKFQAEIEQLKSQLAANAKLRDDIFADDRNQDPV